MADALQVELVAADRVVWSGQASEVLARTVEGDLGVLVDHAPLLSLLLPSLVDITPLEGEKVLVAISDGFISVANNRVSILSEDVHLAHEIDRAAAQSELEAAEQGDDARAVLRAEAKLQVIDKAY